MTSVATDHDLQNLFGNLDHHGLFYCNLYAYEGPPTTNIEYQSHWPHPTAKMWHSCLCWLTTTSWLMDFWGNVNLVNTQILPQSQKMWNWLWSWKSLPPKAVQWYNVSQSFNLSNSAAPCQPYAGSILVCRLQFLQGPAFCRAQHTVWHPFQTVPWLALLPTWCDRGEIHYHNDGSPFH